MSTSPSWFDQDKFSRLVKKVGTKPPAGKAASPAPKAEETPSPKEPAPTLLKIEKPASEVAEPVETKPEPPAFKPEVDKPQSKVSFSFSPSKTAAPLAEKPEEKEPEPSDAPVAEAVVEEEEISDAPEVEEKKEEEITGTEKHLATSALRMMTSQSLSLGKAPVEPSPEASEEEPIRAPAAVSKAPPLPGPTTSSLKLKRTSALPGLKTLFQNEPSAGQTPPPTTTKPMATPPPLKPLFSGFRKAAEKEAETPVVAEGKDLVSLAKIADAGHLSEVESELSTASLAAEWDKADKLEEELDQVTQERDDALAKADALELKLRALEAAMEDNQKIEVSSSDSEVAVHLTKERDAIRADYIRLREDYETLKRENSQPKIGLPREESGSTVALKNVKKELEELQGQLAEKDRELLAAKASASSTDDELETVKNELAGLRGEMVALKDEAKKTKDDASVAQRGLALSQKALQETREALREATESANAGRKPNFS